MGNSFFEKALARRQEQQKAFENRIIVIDIEYNNKNMIEIETIERPVITPK